MINLYKKEMEDVSVSPQKEVEMGFEVSESEGSVSKDLDTLATAIGHDHSVTEADLKSLAQSIGGMKVEIDGQAMTVEEVEKIPDLKRNMEIWEEIRSGNFNHTNMLTSITDEIAEILSHIEGYLSLIKLITLSDTAARYLSRQDGGLNLERVDSLSDVAARHLSHHKGALWLTGLYNVSDIGVRYISQSKNSLFVNTVLDTRISKYRK